MNIRVFFGPPRLCRKRLESVRKDVECVFGIIKQRHRLFRSRIQIWDTVDIENAFNTACILHNMCLKDENWLSRHKVDTNWINLRTGDVLEPSVQVRDKPEIQIDDEIILDSTFEDRSSVGGIKETTTVEKEDGYFSLRAQLVENYKYMMDHGMLAWLK